MKDFAHSLSAGVFTLVQKCLIRVEPVPEQCDQIGRFFCTLGNFLKPLATINLPKYPTFLGNFCKEVKINHFFSEIIFGQLYRNLAIFSSHTGREKQSNTMQ